MATNSWGNVFAMPVLAAMALFSTATLVHDRVSQGRWALPAAPTAHLGGLPSLSATGGASSEAEEAGSTGKARARASELVYFEDKYSMHRHSLPSPSSYLSEASMPPAFSWSAAGTDGTTNFLTDSQNQHIPQ